MEWLKIFWSKEKRDADLLDSMTQLTTALPPAPPGEFDRIMAEMERRGIVPQMRRQHKWHNRFNKIRHFFHMK